MVLLHSNIRGYTSKKEALLEVVKDVDADVCILNETGLKGKNKVNIPGYLTFSKNRQVKNMGGGGLGSGRKSTQLMLGAKDAS